MENSQNSQKAIYQWQYRLMPAALFAIVVLNGCTSKSAPAPKMPPADVLTVEAQQKDVPITGSWVASTQGFTNAQIQPQVAGYLIKQSYNEGAAVRKDQILFEIDPRPFQAALDQAKGQLAQAKGQVEQSQGQVAQSEAQLALANINVKRDTPLAAKRAIAQSQLDNDTQTLAQSQASVKTYQANVIASKAQVEAAQATVETAEINMGFTKVRSLIDGVAGIATTQIGNLVGTSSVLTTVSKVNPIKVYFPISEQEYLAVAGKMKAGAKGGDWLANSAAVPLTMSLADGSDYGAKGRIIFADRQVDNQTGTIRIVGSFPNPGNVLRPGQFAKISAVTSLRKNAVVVPQRCVSDLQGRQQVAVVGADNKAKIVTVKTGPRLGPLWVIEDGLKPGDRVISEGILKVQDGAPVNPKPDNTNEESQKGQ